MVNKPGRRRRGRNTWAYAAAGMVVVVLVVATGWYLYNSGLSAPKSVEYARIDTSMGSFEVELYASATPRTVANFVSLAESGFYTNLVWHRIEPGFVIQTGDPNTRGGGGDRAHWGEGDSGVGVPFEYNSTLHNYKGYLGMASSGAGVGGSSQFYINLKDNSATL
ncbi:MAG: peptidylprolyl isomerase, partial [Thaumarchaeota archaeon]|nr:peptidylprolyl isomerase [Nitrososphaerota archaeon]